jgi:hypothetical protein
MDQKDMQQEEVSIRTGIKAGDDGSQIGSGHAAGNGQFGSGNAAGNGQFGSGT